MSGIGSVYIGTRISPSMNARLERIAAREQNAVSAVIRRLLSAALAAEDAERDTRAARAPRKRSRVS
jgi:predicted transcriptional regulator